LGVRRESESTAKLDALCEGNNHFLRLGILGAQERFVDDDKTARDFLHHSFDTFGGIRDVLQSRLVTQQDKAEERGSTSTKSAIAINTATGVLNGVPSTNGSITLTSLTRPVQTRFMFP
jgi:hypothetical protein